MKRIHFLLLGLTTLAVFALIWWNDAVGATAFQEANTEVSMRKIGHEVLLLSGDHTSRVLPVERLTKNNYRLRFEARFEFVPDSLIQTIHRVAKAEQLPSEYIVRVRECAHNQVVYSYTATAAVERGIQCSARKQLRNCYAIELLFQPKERLSAIWIIAFFFGFTILAFLVMVWMKRKQSPKTTPMNESNPESGVIVLGNYRFHYRDRYLMLGSEQIRLTAKQTKLLHLFAISPNEIIERTTLMKVWEDEGVIVGRSLDVFVSKLRKIFEVDPSVRLMNVHSRGYILEVDV
ncbi:MAG: helix-turn-helix domain-containing protein [Fluviicola sp.]|nr:helix-turn-helix domain-containing protein [Fluviicola sp.]